jgi:hypothetical protein
MFICAYVIISLKKQQIIKIYVAFFDTVLYYKLKVLICQALF